MPERTPVIVGIGEVLWDVFPDARKLGGAPMNFAVHARALGTDAAIISRVGDDPDGDDIIEAVRNFGLPADPIQRDSEHATGRVNVTVDQDGQPTFEIVADVAYDFIAETPEARDLVSRADAVCFGSLAQRTPTSRMTIRSLLAAAARARWKVYDINLRQHYYSREVVAASLGFATLLKMNDDEVGSLLELVERHEEREEKVHVALEAVMAAFSLDLICVTMGAEGCMLYDGTQRYRLPGYAVDVVDTVGSGDAFTAGLVAKLLAGAPPNAAGDFANRVGAFVAMHPGGTPQLDEDVIAGMTRKS